MNFLLGVLLLHWFTLASGFWYLLGDCQLDAAYPDLCITSPNYPRNYSNREACSASILGSEERVLMVLAFDTEPGYDHLKIGPHRFSGTNPANLTGRKINSSTALTWKSDNAGTRSGWRICAVPNTGGPWLSVGDCRVHSEDPDCVSNEAYPLDYKSNQSCYLTLPGDRRRRLLNVTRTRPGLSSDALSVATSTYSWTSHTSPWQARLQGQLLDYQEEMALKWSSGGFGSSGQPGWRICAWPERVSASVWREGVWWPMTDCGIEVDQTDAQCLIQHVWRSGGLQNDICWAEMASEIPRVLEVKNMDSSNGDTLLRHSTMSWGEEVEQPVLNGMVMHSGEELVWEMHAANQGSGWKVCALPAEYQPEERFWSYNGDCQIDIQDSECISTLNFPGIYGNNERCFMQILSNSTRQLEVTSFDTELDVDVLRLEGPNGVANFSGSDSGELHGVQIDATMNLTWSTDENSTLGGWRICSRVLRTTTTTQTTTTQTTTSTTKTWTSYEVWSFVGDCEIDESDSSCITSKNFNNGQGHGRVDTCTMTIVDEERDLVVTASDIYDGWSFFRFGNGTRVSGNHLGELLQYRRISHGTPLYWASHVPSWRAHWGHGWRICAVPTRTLDLSAISTSWNVTGDCTIDEHDDDCVTTPSYPNSYPDLQQCEISYVGIPGRMLSVENISVGVSDLLHLTESRNGVQFEYASQRRAAPDLDRRSLDDSTRLAWRSAYSSSANRGWKICARSFPNWSVQGPCQVVDGACVASPRYPRHYGNSQSCSMYVTNYAEMPLEVVWFHTQAHDVLRFNGRSFSGRSLASNNIEPLIGEMTWHTNRYGTTSGWKICGRPASSETQVMTLPETTTTTTTTAIATTGAAFLDFSHTSPPGTHDDDDREEGMRVLDVVVPSLLVGAGLLSFAFYVVSRQGGPCRRETA